MEDGLAETDADFLEMGGRRNMSEFGERLERVRERVQKACEKAGRDPGEVKLLAVAKTFGTEAVAEAVESGISVIGESRVQEAKQKIPLCSSRIEWHMVGHLQRNKVSDAVSLFRMIHSVDSYKLLEAVNRACDIAGCVMPVCLEVNVSGESSKSGLAPEDGSRVLDQSRVLMNVEIAGLMTIPPFTEDPEGARPFFKRLRELRDEWRRCCDLRLDELSMGMSHDFEVAIEEGATWIRLGSALFGPRRPIALQKEQLLDATGKSESDSSENFDKD